jgi:hypothetical protein
MKKLLILPLLMLAATLAVRAEDATTTKPAPKPDLLKTCPVSGEKLGGDMGEPVKFVYKDQEVKLCCKGCKKDFDKTPEKFMKKIRKADKVEKTETATEKPVDKK